MKHEMPVMTEEKRQALIADCKAEIAEAQKALKAWGDQWIPHLQSKIERQQIALACLEAEPEYNAAKGFELHFGISATLCDELQEDGYACWVSYSAPPVPVMQAVELPSAFTPTITALGPSPISGMRLDHTGGWLNKARVIAAIRAAGGEVRE